MGFLDKLFSRPGNCPLCGAPGGQASISGYRCVDPRCRNFDLDGEWGSLRKAFERGLSGSRARPGFERTLAVDYENFRGERREFTADKASARIRGIHLSVHVRPSGRRIALHRDRIRNIGDIIAALREVAQAR